MPLVALTNGERIVSTALDMETARAQPKGTYTCPGCDKAMHPKRIERTGTQFFAHYTDTGCSHGKGESPAHLHLKEVVHDIAVKAGWTADYEVRLETDTGIKIVDVLLTHPKQATRKAVEIQLSPQADATYQRRSRTYAQHGIDTLWLTRHTAPERKDVTAVQLWADNAKQLPLDAYLHADTLDTGIREASVEGVRNRPIHIDALIPMWLTGELTHHYQLELNPHTAYTPLGSFAVITETEHHLWIRSEQRKALAQAHRDAKRDLAEHTRAEAKRATHRAAAEKQRREAREAKIAEMRKKQASDEIQAAVDRGKARQREHRIAPQPTTWKATVQAWLDAPVPDDIGETLDRLSEVYNAQKAASPEID